jgi:hypothetical protein
MARRLVAPFACSLRIVGPISAAFCVARSRVARTAAARAAADPLAIWSLTMGLPSSSLTIFPAASRTNLYRRPPRLSPPGLHGGKRGLGARADCAQFLFSHHSHDADGQAVGVGHGDDHELHTSLLQAKQEMRIAG